METKTCTRCNEEKDIALFQKRKASKDGLTASCKACLADYDKSRANNPERVKARNEYAKTEQGKAARRRAQDTWLKKNPIKRVVHIAVGNAIRDGKLIKQPCEVCGCNNVHAHHCDYSKPLDVMWLCSKHHEEWHQINSEGKNAI